MKNTGMGGPGRPSVKLDSAPPGYHFGSSAAISAACDRFFASRGMKYGRAVLEEMRRAKRKKRKKAKG